MHRMRNVVRLLLGLTLVAGLVAAATSTPTQPDTTPDALAVTTPSPVQEAGIVPVAATKTPESMGCNGPYRLIADFDLRGPAGKKRGDIGALLVYRHVKAGPDEICARMQHGGRTNGKSMTSFVKLGRYQGTNGKITWANVVGSRFDSGTNKHYAGGVHQSTSGGHTAASAGATWKDTYYAVALRLPST